MCKDLLTADPREKTKSPISEGKWTLSTLHSGVRSRIEGNLPKFRTPKVGVLATLGTKVFSFSPTSTILPVWKKWTGEKQGAGFEERQ
ncbi:hypothetical protein I8748_18910 [Nostoc sp. CENA67]|uniref:Uncharacterized protein n=1 Tax=Amazonocrinis nigriterrae CENA67 TaxID=2794033 RepID=A0A8J7HRK1_9NOST|nr:hypothetical protein [Amazonocrinis nigriterrae]MBH8564232.1 hypothetical protein [Amazonocrinis nigriterrae CENA67]